MKHGNGKIANLPEHIRDELNWRLNDGDEGLELVAWLNAKPEVIDVVTRLFDGKPISPQNLSLWRAHGYLRWHAYHVVMRETSELAQNSGAVEATGIDCEKMLWALKANYADMIQRWMVCPTGQMDYRLDVFKKLTIGVLAMSRDEIQRERLQLLREKQADKSESSASSRVSRSPDRRSTEGSGTGAGRRQGKTRTEGSGSGAGEAQAEAPAAEAPRRAEPPVPQPPTPPIQQAPALPNPTQSSPPQPPAPTAPPKPVIPPNRDRRGKYGLL